MNILEIIEKKRDKKELTDEEIKFFIKGYTSGEIADYQAAALIMAIYINGMTDKESTNLTMEMANSGDILDLSKIDGIIVDKHSTGGVGDKVSIILLPKIFDWEIFKIILLIVSEGIRLFKSSNASLRLLPKRTSSKVCLNSLDNSESIFEAVTSKALCKFLPDSNDNVNTSKKYIASLSSRDPLLATFWSIAIFGRKI